MPSSAPVIRIFAIVFLLAFLAVVYANYIQKKFAVKSKILEQIIKTSHQVIH